MGEVEVAGKLRAAFVAYEERFFTTDNKDGSLPFDWLGTEAADVITMTLKGGDLSFQETVTFMRKNDSFGLNLALVEIGSLSGTEAEVDGKYLEENVTMSTQFTDGAYAISPGERPIIDAPYCTVSWESKAPIGGAGGWEGHKRLQVSSVDAETGEQVMKYTMYFNEDVFGTVDVTAVGQLKDILAWLAII